MHCAVGVVALILAIDKSNKIQMAFWNLETIFVVIDAFDKEPNKIKIKSFNL